MKIVGIHGIAHTHLTSPEIQAEWLPSLQGGIEEANQMQPKEAKFSPITKEDLTIAAYGALFRPSGTRAGNLPKFIIWKIFSSRALS